MTDVNYKELEQLLDEKLKRFAAKEDLAEFATKKDLERFATKKDLERFATKEDLKKYATKEALHEGLEGMATRIIEDLGGIMREFIDTLDRRKADKQDLDNLEKRVTDLEDASEVYHN